MTAKEPVAVKPPPSRYGAKRLLGRWGAVLAVLALYAYPFPHFEILRSPNELSRVYQVRAIVDDHALSVNAQVARYGSMGDLSEHERRMYPNKAPGISFLGAPIYAVLRAVLGGAERVENRTLLYFLRLLLCALPTVLLLVPLRRYAARVSGDARAADAAVLAYAFGTLGFTYSLLYFSHQLAAVLAIASFLCLERARERGRPVLEVLAGFLAGYAVVTEYTMAPVAALLAIYGLATAREKGRALVRIAVGAAPCVVMLMAYHEAAWGSPFSVGYAHVQNRTFAEWHAQGVMGVAAPKLSSLLGNLFSPARGLFFFSPVLLAAVAGIAAQWRESKADAALAAAVTAFYFFLAAAFLYEAWGWMLGPRHLVPLVPFLVAPLACALAWLRTKGARRTGWTALAGVVGGLGAASIVTTGLGTAVYPHIPDEFRAAMPHLVWPIVAAGKLPYNVWILATGSGFVASWIPWFVALALIALLVAWLATEPPRRTIGLLAATAAFAVHLAIVALASPPLTKQEQRTRTWILQTWEPTPANVKPGLVH